jgi:hypothetical protein
MGEILCRWPFLPKPTWNNRMCLDGGGRDLESPTKHHNCHYNFWFVEIDCKTVATDLLKYNIHTQLQFTVHNKCSKGIRKYLSLFGLFWLTKWQLALKVPIGCQSANWLTKWQLAHKVTIGSLTKTVMYQEEVLICPLYYIVPIWLWKCIFDFF